MGHATIEGIVNPATNLSDDEWIAVREQAEALKNTPFERAWLEYVDRLIVRDCNAKHDWKSLETAKCHAIGREDAYEHAKMVLEHLINRAQEILGDGQSARRRRNARRRPENSTSR